MPLCLTIHLQLTVASPCPLPVLSSAEAQFSVFPARDAAVASASARLHLASPEVRAQVYLRPERVLQVAGALPGADDPQVAPVEDAWQEPVAFWREAQHFWPPALKPQIEEQVWWSAQAAQAQAVLHVAQQRALHGSVAPQEPFALQVLAAQESSAQPACLPRWVASLPPESAFRDSPKLTAAGFARLADAPAPA